MSSHPMRPESYGCSRFRKHAWRLKYTKTQEIGHRARRCISQLVKLGDCALNVRNIGSDICALLDAPRSYPGLQRRCRSNYPRLTPGVRELIQPVSDVERDFAETKPLLVRRLKFIERPLMAQSGRSAQSRQVHAEPFEIGERAMGQSSLVGGPQDNPGRLVRFEGLLPARCT